MSRGEVTKLTSGQVAVAAAVLARAFHSDPLTSYMVPDPDERALALPIFYEAAVRVTHRFGEAFVTSGEVVGAALWFPPEQSNIGSSHFDAVGAGDLPDRLPPGAFDRFTSVIAYLDRLRSRDVLEAHWYLAVLGVDPQSQGRGIGTRLLRPVCERADASRIPCYLETVKPENVPFYQHLGFKVVVESEEPQSAIRFWTMLRTRSD